MRLFKAICRLPGRIANAPVTMDGEGLPSYILLGAGGGPTCLGLWFYGADLMEKGQIWAGIAVFIGCGLFALLMAVVPFVYKPSTNTASHETDPVPGDDDDFTDK